MSQTTNSVLQRYNRLMGLPEDYKHGNNARQSLVDLAQTVDPDGITDLGDMEPLDVGQSLPSGMASGGNAPTGVSLPVPTVLDTLAKYKSPLDTAVDHAMETLPHTLHALRNSLNNEPDKLKSLARQSGLSIGAVESDPAFAQKKIQSDLYARALGDVAQNWRLSPNTAAFLREADALEQLSLTSDTALWALERDLRNREHGFFDSGYIGAALNAWDIGLVSREVGQLGYKWMLGSITEEERQRLDILRRAEAHYHGQKEEMALLERMVRGTVEALGVPLAGGIAGAFEFLGRYGKEGLTAGAMAGAVGGSAAGGVGAVPGAVAGGITGLSAVAQAGFANDMMRQEGGLTFLSLVDMGVPEDTARVLAFAAGGLKGALEYVGLREVGRIFPGAEKFLTSSGAAQALKTLEKNPSVAAMLGDTAIAMLRGLAGETGTEVAQEVVDIAAEETGRQLSNVNKAAPTAGEIGERLLEVAKETLISTTLVAGAGGAVRGAWHYRNAKKRESLLQGLRDADAGIMDTVANAVQQSPVMRDMPETGAALLQHLADNGVTPDTVYIRPEAVQQIFFQAEDPELMAIAAEMGITPESLQDNLTLGTDVAVDFAKATEHIMADSARYEALRGDMRTSPLLPTDAEMAQLENMAEDAEARLAYLDNLLAPLAAEAEEAQTRHDQRMEIAAPYVQQLLGAGYSQNQAEAYGLVLAANAERMASLFGMSPQDYLAERFAGYVPMQQAEFEELAYGGLDGLIENRETAALLQELGITPGMSAAARRRRLQPEFAYVWGKVNPESVQNQYGMEQYRELRRMFGPGFFARKGEGLGIDVLATSFYDEERGMYDMNRSDLDTDTFIERVFMPHDEFERGVAGQLRQNMLWQRDAEGNAIAPGETAPRVAAVVEGATNSYGVPLERVTVIEGDITPADVEAALKELAGRDLPNLIEGITAQVNRKQRDKLNSKKAAEKSKTNGFTRSEHRGIAAKIAEAWRWAAEAQRGGDVKNGQPDLTMRRFVSALNVNGRDAFAWITVKDGKDGPRIYSVELMEKEKLRDMVNGGTDITATGALNRSFDGIINRLNRPVNPRGGVPLERVTVIDRELSPQEVRTALQALAGRDLRNEIEGITAQVNSPQRGKLTSGAAQAKSAANSFSHGEHNSAAAQIENAWKWAAKAFDERHRSEHSNATVGRYVAALSVNGREAFALITTKKGAAGERIYSVELMDEQKLRSTLNTGSTKAESNVPVRSFNAIIKRLNRPVNPRGGLYQREQTRNARGAMTTLPDGRAVVGLFKSANASTVLHETAHFWLEELRRAAQLDTAPDWVREAWGKLQKAYGFEGHLLDDTAEWSRVQERFARDFEAYTREGKAPSWELQTAFNRFRNWLVDIYRSVKSLLGGNELGEDVRQVFDALLATEEEIEQSRRAVEGGSVMDLLPEGEVSQELRDRYARAAQKAYENASAAIANRKLVDRRAAEKRIREEATVAIDGSETYQLLARLRAEGGIAFADLLQHANEDVAYELRRKWGVAKGEGKALIKKGGTLDILDVAAQFDQDSGQGLVGVLLETPTRREAIDAEVERRLAEWDAQYDAEVEYSAAYDAALAVELEALTGQRQISPAQLRRQMEAITGVKKMDAVDAEYKALKARLQADEQTARRAWNAATREANANARQKLAELKEQERLRRAALGAAYRARMERDDIVRQLRRIGASKSVPYEYMLQIRRLLGNWKGLGTEGQRLDPATLRKMPSLQEFLAEKSTETGFDEPVSVPEWMLNDMQAQRFGDLSLEQMRDVKRMVTMLAHMGRAEGKMLAAEEQREIKAVAAECAESANKLSARVYVSDRAGVLDTVRGALRKALSSLTSVRFLARALDGFNKQGANHDAWLMPLQQARSNELLMEREMEAKLREALAPLLRVGKLHTAFAIDGVPLMPDVSRQWAGMWDMEKVYCVALNMGNAGNLKALLRGYGWSEENINAITARMTAEEWQAVQAVWDAIDTLYPRLNEVYKKLKGVPLPKVEAQPFTVQTADGQTLRLKGGYYPLIFDQRLSDKAAENQSVDEMLNGMEAILRSPNPQSGMTKERKGDTLPPRLSLNVLDRHVRDTVHYITHALPLRDTVRLFREPVFKEAFIRAAGRENYDQLLPWLRGIARPGGEQATGAVAAIDWLARRGSLYALGANMKSALLQLTSMGNSWSEVGFTAFWRGAATLLSSPQQSWQMVREKSAYMQSRSRLLDDTLRREYEDIRARGVQGLRFGGIS